MAEYTDILQSLLLTYKWPIVFGGAFLFGETTIITASVFAFAQGWSPSLLFFLTFTGTILSDSLWFFLGQKLLLPRMMRRDSWEKQQRTVDAVLGRFGDRPFLLLLFFKFLYGTRVLIIIYLSIHKMRYATFLLFNGIGTIIWLVVLIGASYLAVESSLSIFDTLHTGKLIFTGIIVTLIAINILNLWITRRLENK